MMASEFRYDLDDSDPKFRCDFEASILAGRHARGRRVSIENTIAFANEFGDLGFVGDENRCYPAVDEVRRPRHLHVELP